MLVNFMGAGETTMVWASRHPIGPLFAYDTPNPKPYARPSSPRTTTDDTYGDQRIPFAANIPLVMTRRTYGAATAAAPLGNVPLMAAFRI